jgi:hypothetical protein
VCIELNATEHIPPQISETKVFLIIVEIFWKIYSGIYRAKTRRKFRISITHYGFSKPNRPKYGDSLKSNSEMPSWIEDFFPFSMLAHFWETKDTHIIYKWFVFQANVR